MKRFMVRYARACEADLEENGDPERSIEGGDQDSSFSLVIMIVFALYRPIM